MSGSSRTTPWSSREANVLTKKPLTFLLSVVLLNCWLIAQEGQQSGMDHPHDDNDQMMFPAQLLGTSPLLAFKSELERSNFLNGGLAVGSTFDDNVLNSGSDRLSNFAYSVFPYIALSQSRSRINWTLSYGAGFTMNQRYSVLNQGSHDLHLEGIYRLAPHANLRLFDSFLIRTGFFDQANSPAAFSTPGILNRPNQSIVTPLSRQTANLSTAELDYRFSVRSMVGASGTFYLSHFRDTPGGYSLIDTESAGGQAFYNYQLSARNLTGLTYRFQRFSFSPVGDGASVHSVLLIYTLQLKPMLGLSFFAGPEYSNVHAAIPSNSAAGAIPADGDSLQRKWSGSGGATLNWNGQRNSVTAEFIREVTDGGGLLGVVRANIADGGIRRQLSPFWGASLGMAYATNDSLIAFSTSESRLQTASTSFSLDRSLGDHLSLRFGYTRNWQQRWATPVAANINHNRAWLSIAYNFSRPLGR
jgi:hypothetical protein